MANWFVYVNRKGSLNLSYKNVLTGQIHLCGELRRDTPKEMIVEWVMDKGDPNPGDLIKFDDGLTLFIHPQGATA